jgi:hypothetical protein
VSMNGNTQVGKIPNEEDIFWIEMAGKITPEKSIERLDDHAKYLFSTISIVGTLLTGFGIFSCGETNVLHNPWIIIPVALACLSLALSMMGITPKVERLNRHDINSVRDYYNNQIIRRGRFIFWAGVAFSLSLLSVAVVLALPLKTPPVTSAISINLADADGKTKLIGKIDFQNMPLSGTADTEITGYKDAAKDSQKKTLLKDISHADPSGRMTIEAQLDQANDYQRFEISSKITDRGKIIHEKKVEVKR